MIRCCFFIFVFAFVGCHSAQSYNTVNSDLSNTSPDSILNTKKWIHGSANCKYNKDPAFEVFRFNETSYILRQNKCLSFEAPFIYLLFGTNKTLVLDTGAIKEADKAPLFSIVASLASNLANNNKLTTNEILVIHTHSHNDHHAGDTQFTEKPNTTVVSANHQAVTQYFGFKKWPQGEAYINLGNRKITIIPTLGHQKDAITLYDEQNKWLLTGDTLYPGYIYIKSWKDYRTSIARLFEFSKKHEVDAILGSHIEMTLKAGEYYPVGTTFQPEEAALALKIGNLAVLNSALQKTQKPKKIVSDTFIIAPLSTFQKVIGSILKWLFY